MGLIKATTGQYTSVYVANKKQVKLIKVLQSIDATAGASATYENAFDSPSSILSFTKMNDTPVTGKLDVVVSDNFDFQKIAMGYGADDIFDGFSLTRAINVPLYILLSERDIKTNTGFSSLWLKEVNLTSDGETQAIKAIKTVSYSLAAGDKIRLPNPGIIEQLPVEQTGFTATLSYTPVVYNGVEILPAGMATDGSETYFVADITTGAIIPKDPTNGWTISTNTLSLNGTSQSAQTILVAYQHAV